MKRVCVNCKHCEIARTKKAAYGEIITGASCKKKDAVLIDHKVSGKHHKEVLEDFKKGNTLPMECFEK